MTAIMHRLHRDNHPVERIGRLRAAVLGANDGIISTPRLAVRVAAAAKNAVSSPGSPRPNSPS
ncbi:hypothetical protein CYD53_10946 [Bosea psychrotolerans]|uniref:Uncharacterized protein n=1 Tax=Bosea psychrotolerans TaxID=1871628 RepID=A0A2S4M6I1_9HYPH|nr:hypothetical protein CYD53_10946 [Bosea psychrotolerans]